MYEKLEQINERPAPFSVYTAADLWTDEHTSSRMLAFHLDASNDLASRGHGFIEGSVEWMVSRFGLGPGVKVADFGCGPGLYTTRLAGRGCDVTGIDFSERSIGYARGQAEKLGLDIEYIHADYLEFETERRFDLIAMITCDFCALGPDQRRDMLDRFRRHLVPGGALVMDVYSMSAFEEREEGASYGSNLMDGFWSAEPYFGFLNTFRYPDERVMLDKFTIVERDRTKVVYNWAQHFDRESLRSEIEGGGLLVEDLLGDVAGAPIEGGSREIAVVARKPA